MPGTILSVLTALFWGTSDTLASLAARRYSIFKTTFIAQSSGFVIILLTGITAYLFLGLPFSLQTLLASMGIGMITGIAAAVGFFSFYRALETGPVALVSPITSTSSVFTLLLAALILRQELTLIQTSVLALCVVGVLFASLDLANLRLLLRTAKGSLLTKGVRLALVATLAFAVMDFGIGAAVTVSNWYLPVLWTRIFSLCSLLLLAVWRHRQRLHRSSSTTTPPPPPTSPLDDPEATLIHPGGFNIWALARKEENLAISDEETVILRTYRGYNAVLAHSGDTSSHQRVTLSRINTAPLVDATEEQGVQHTISLSLPHLEDLAQLRRPLRSKTGLGILLALLAGLLETAAALSFSGSTALLPTGLAAAIASGYSLIVVAFGLTVYRERLTWQQSTGIILFLSGVVILAVNR